MRFPNPWLGHVFSAWNKFILSGYEMFTSINVALNCYNGNPMRHTCSLQVI